MALIPNVNTTFGTVIPEAPNRQPIARAADFGTGDAIAQAGQVAGQIGFTNLEAITQQRQAAADKAKALNDRIASVTAHATIENDLNDLADKYKVGVLQGAFAAGGAREGEDPVSRYNEDAAQIVSTRADGLAPDLAATVKAESIRTTGKLANTINDSVVHRTQQDVGVGLIVAGDEFERAGLRDRPMAVAKYEATVDAMGPQAGMNPQQIAEAKSKFREKVTYNDARMTVLGARDNTQSLDLAAKIIQGDGFKDLGPEKLAPLLQGIEVRKQTLIAQQAAADARAAAAQQRRLTEAGIAVDGFQKIVDNGGAPDAKYALDVSQAVAGTPYAPMLQQLVKTAGERAGFASLPPQQQRAQLDAMRADANAKGTDPDNEKRISTLQTIADKGARQLQADPLIYGANRGLIPGVAPLQMDSIEHVAAGIATRIDSARTVSAAVGQPVSPLTSNEATSLSTTINAFPVQQRARALKAVSAAISDPSQLRALASQMNEKDPAVALALLSGQHQTDTGRPLAELILTGSDADKHKLLDETGMVPTMRSIAQKVAAVPWSTPAARDAAILASQLVYKGQKSTSIPTSEDNAIKLATGGIINWADSKIPLPYGMQTEGDFKNAMKTIDAQRLTEQAGADHVMVRGQSIPMATLANTLPATKLLPAGDGQYWLQSGNAIVQLPNGRPFKLRVQ